jgi:hypothetical protein
MYRVVLPRNVQKCLDSLPDQIVTRILARVSPYHSCVYLINTGLQPGVNARSMKNCFNSLCGRRSRSNG